MLVAVAVAAARQPLWSVIGRARYSAARAIIRPLGDVIVLRTPLTIAEADPRRDFERRRRPDRQSALVVDARYKCLLPFGHIRILHSHDSRYRRTQQDWIGPDRRPRRAERAGAGDGPQPREPRLVPGRRRDGAPRSRRSRLARRGHGWPAKWARTERRGALPRSRRSTIAEHCTRMASVLLLRALCISGSVVSNDGV